MVVKIGDNPDKSFRGAYRRSNHIENESATPFGVAITMGADKHSNCSLVYKGDEVSDGLKKRALKSPFLLMSGEFLRLFP